MDEDGGLLPPGEIGEIVIRGPNVTAGYENNPEANASAFAHGWFRTGDQGALDDEGYLRLTGRLKEIINRGGEKISPLEVDEVLMDHPAVAQVVTFAHAARQARRGGRRRRSCCARAWKCSERDIRDFAADAARRLQGAAQGRDPRRNPEGRDRQAAAHRPRREARPRPDAQVAVFGAGAIGGYLAAKLAAAGRRRPVAGRARAASRGDPEGRADAARQDGEGRRSPCRARRAAGRPRRAGLCDRHAKGASGAGWWTR